MKALSIKEIETELKERTHKDLVMLCLRLGKFKKENKELLTYLVFESIDELNFVNEIKTEMDEQFAQINTSSFYYVKKSTRKILRRIKTYIRYSKVKETEIELLIYFCLKLKSLSPSISKSKLLLNIYTRELISINKKVETLHEDLQYDYNKTIKGLHL